MSDVSSAIAELSSASEIEKSIKDDNQRRCDFFKYFEFDENDRIGVVSLLFILSVVKGMLIDGLQV